MKRVRIEFTRPPEGLTQVIQDAAGVVETAADRVAAKATSISPSHARYRVYMRQIKFAQDNLYGVSRPAAVVETTDRDTYAEDAREKTLIKAVGEK